MSSATSFSVVEAGRLGILIREITEGSVTMMTELIIPYGMFAISKSNIGGTVRCQLMVPNSRREQTDIDETCYNVLAHNMMRGLEGG